MKRPLFVLFALATGILLASEPAWWTATDTNIKSGASANNSGPANQGQLKNVAKKAAIYLNASLYGGAGYQVNDMVAGFHKSSGDLSPVNIGQLKAVAKPFYDRLIAAGYGTNSSLQSHNAPGATPWPYAYPWKTGMDAIPNSQNLVPANIGQLKWVFSFDLAGFDSNLDGIPDSGLNVNLDINNNGVLDGLDDFDGDGVANGTEISGGYNPLDPNSHPSSAPSPQADASGANQLVVYTPLN